jgi:hypothetical protein
MVGKEMGIPQWGRIMEGNGGGRAHGDGNTGRVLGSVEIDLVPYVSGRAGHPVCLRWGWPGSFSCVHVVFVLCVCVCVCVCVRTRARACTVLSLGCW